MHVYLGATNFCFYRDVFVSIVLFVQIYLERLSALWETALSIELRSSKVGHWTTYQEWLKLTTVQNSWNLENPNFMFKEHLNSKIIFLICWSAYIWDSKTVSFRAIFQNVFWRIFHTNRLKSSLGCHIVLLSRAQNSWLWRHNVNLKVSTVFIAGILNLSSRDIMSKAVHV